MVFIGVDGTPVIVQVDGRLLVVIHGADTVQYEERIQLADVFVPLKMVYTPFVSENVQMARVFT